MGLNTDKILLQSLNNVGVSTVPSGWYDISSYTAGAFFVVVTSGTGTLTPTFNMSLDNGTTNLGAIPTAELAAPTGQSGVGAKRFPLIGPSNQLWVQVSSVITVAAVTANVFFVGRRT